MQLEYCLREPLRKFEGLSTFYCNFINVVLHIWDIRPIPTIRTTVRIMMMHLHWSFQIESKPVAYTCSHMNNIVANTLIANT